MGHLADQVEVAAIETQVSKVSTSPASPATPQHLPQTNPQQAQQQGATGGEQAALSTHCSPPRPHQQPVKHPHSQNVEDSVTDKTQKGEKGEGGAAVEEEGEEENGWWAERVVGALGGMGEYGDTWYRSHAHLLHGDGPLPHPWRLYIAALAVCRHEVAWLVQALLADFRSAGGDIRWVAGIHYAPPKLYALAAINNLLAHRPWMLLPQHIQQLTKGEDSWSLGELCQALCIMTHFHALASFLHGVGLSTLPTPSKKDEGQPKDKKARSNDKPATQHLPSPPSSHTTAPCPTPTNANCSHTSRSAKAALPTRFLPQGLREYAHLTVNPNLAYEDLNGNDETRSPSFSVHEYNWQDHGYAMCSRLVGEVGAFLDERFTSALTATYAAKKLADKAVVDQEANAVTPSTATHSEAPAKMMPVPTKALWNYVQWLLGIHHDDCDYVHLNKHLDPHIKTFVKAACCFPETLASGSPSSQPRQVEMSVVVMEARLQSELLYALRAIMLHQC